MPAAPFDLNLRGLRALPVLVARGTVSAAAAEIGLSQPALTQSLAKLERQLDARLFERRPGGLAPTPGGLALAERSAAAFAHLSGASRGSRGARGFLRPEQLMTATQLSAFLHVADSGGFAAAARDSGHSQPAVHRAVREFEQLCGVALLERRGRGVVLTAAGRRMARAVRLAHRELEAALADLEPREGETGRVVVGAMPLSRVQLLPRALAAFACGPSRAAVEVVEGSWRELVDPLADGVIDMMIGALRADPPPGLEQRPLMVDRLCIVARAGHPLCASPTLSRSELAAYPWIAGPENTPLARRLDALFEGGPRPSAPISCGSTLVIRGLLCETDFLTLLSPAQVALEIATGVLTTLGPPLETSVRTIGLVTRTGWRPAAAQRRLTALIEEAARSLSLPEKQ